jgi:hypothetical protein
VSKHAWLPFAAVMNVMAAAACSDGNDLPAVDAAQVSAAPQPCPPSIAGDPALSPELQILTLGPGIDRRVIDDGATVALVLPPQGGRIVLAGVRARNLDPCGVNLTGVMRDPGSQQVRLDGRTVNLRPRADGWVESSGTDLAAFANIPVCPNEWAAADLASGEFELTVTVEDRGGRVAARSIRVRPSCEGVEAPARCACLCQAGYRLGQACPGI